MEAQLSSIDSGYAKRRKEHLALINQLRAIGAQADLDLPRIAVIGNQSAGKSSLVEAISGIHVPRDAGTCTRCPMECRLASSSGPWQCQVSIRWEYDASNVPLDEVREVPFGSLITEKKDVELVLRRAQYAILNPKVDMKKFVDVPSQDLKKQHKDMLKFSRNVVCVDLVGPDLTDLAFVDLPGIIQNADAETVQLVEDLVRAHIKGNCLILVTVPMSDDIENQKAMQIAKQEDPSGIRTIGVMTKPDTLTSGATKAREIWLEVIEGRRFPLRHGYYCTRQPDDDERTNGITADQARKAELDFFARTSPWNRTAQQQRFGTRNLITSLSKLLSQVIDDTLPKLQAQVLSQLSACTDRLASLPPAVTTEPSAYVLSKITAFCTDVNLLVAGDSQNATLVQQNRKTYATYKRDVRASAPRFVPYPSKEVHGAPAMQSWGEIDEEDEEDMVVDGREDGRMYLDDVRKHIETSLTRELPNNVPYSAKISLIRKTQDSWEFDSRTCLDSVSKALEKTLSALVTAHFQRYESLKSRLTHAVSDLLHVKYDETWKHITLVLEREETPYTQNGHYLQVTKDRYLAKYKDARAGKVPFDEPASKRRRTTTEGDSTPTTNPFSFSTPTTTTVNGGSESATSNKRKASPPESQTASTSGATDASSKAAATSSGTSTTNPAPTANGNSSSTSSAPGFSNFTFSSRFGTAPATTLPQKQALMESTEREQLELQALSILARLGYTNTTAEDFGKLIPPDVYEQEMDVMAEVRAYFQVSYKRMIDNVPMTIDHTFLFSFARALQQYLIEKLAVASPARCAAYLAEDPHIVAEREELMARKKRLESVQTELFNFGL